jgi:cytoskeletal protein RodZ
MTYAGLFAICALAGFWIVIAILRWLSETWTRWRTQKDDDDDDHNSSSVTFEPLQSELSETTPKPKNAVPAAADTDASEKEAEDTAEKPTSKPQEG